MLPGHLSKRAFSKTSSPADWALPATKQLTRKEFLKTFLISPNLIAEYPDLFPSFSLSLELDFQYRQIADGGKLIQHLKVFF